MTFHVDLGAEGYPVYLERGALKNIGACVELNCRVMIITDSGVPREYVKSAKECCGEPYVYCLPSGEKSKSMENAQKILEKMLGLGFDRRDCVVSVGGGVVGDLGGFVASIYMRGIDFYNIPTTTLSQVDSSIGGKTGVNLCGVKNPVGTFYQPKGAIIDTDTLLTLDCRDYMSGLYEALKAGIIGDRKLYDIFLRGDFYENIDEIIYRALMVKKEIVEKDERESGIRKILNFGHTIGHGIESSLGLGTLSHGECVGIGMIPMILNDNLREEVRGILEKMSPNINIQYDKKDVMRWIANDKKVSAGKITAVVVEEIGRAELREMPLEKFGEIFS